MVKFFKWLRTSLRKKRPRSPAGSSSLNSTQLEDEEKEIAKYLDKIDSIAKQMLQKKQKIEKKKQQLNEDKEQLNKLVRQFLERLTERPERFQSNDVQKSKDQNEQFVDRLDQISEIFLSGLDEDSAHSNLDFLVRQWKKLFS
uniref:Uncharacterized protein n=1 Tax=Meloidogyne enterolobii TaxID=390850 RepID=A0A6V7TT38_MELEN|nr:unnamed protein product [Meloidogyne enterolobii]